MNPILFSLPGLLAAAICSGQVLSEGYDDQVEGLPANAGNVLAVGNGRTVWFDGSDLMLRGVGHQRSLLSFPTPVFGSFTLQVGPSTMLFGESSTHGIWLVSLNGAPPTQPLVNLALNYDAVLFAPNLAIVSARTSGFSGQDNDLWAVDLQSGSTQLLATLPGSSGPVAVDSGGSLYYATAGLTFPTPPGLTAVLRFPHPVVAQALANQRVLGLAHAQVVLTGLDSASDLAFDDDGDLFFVDWFNSRIAEIDDADGASPSSKSLVDYGTATFGGSGLQFSTSTNQGAFEPFQPLGRTLRVHESTFGTLSQIRVLSPAGARLAPNPPAPIPAGHFTLQISGGPSNGLGLVAIALPAGLGLTQFTVPGFEQPVFWHQGLLLPANTHFVSFDATGSASLLLANPGFTPPLQVLAQAAFVDAISATIGATGPATLLLAP